MPNVVIDFPILSQVTVTYPVSTRGLFVGEVGVVLQFTANKILVEFLNAHGKAYKKQWHFKRNFTRNVENSI